MAPRRRSAGVRPIRQGVVVKVVVTGASGHLGRATVLGLRARGHEVIGCSRADLDLRQDRSVMDLASRLDGATAVVHLAALHPPSTASTTARDRRDLLETNVLGTMRVLDAARKGIAAFVYASSFEVYGVPLSNPIDEQHRTHPLTDYGATKLAGEDHALAFGHEQQTRVVCLRMPAIYGPGEHTPRALPLFLQSVLRGEIPSIQGDGEDLRDELYIEDAARAIAAALLSKCHGIFNVADGEAHSIAEIARTAMRVAEMEGDVRFLQRTKPRLDYHMNIERARRELGFSPEVSLERGMAAQYAYLRGAGP